MKYIDPNSIDGRERMALGTVALLSIKEVSAVISERDDLRATVERLTRERDDARGPVSAALVAAVRRVTRHVEGGRGIHAGRDFDSLMEDVRTLAAVGIIPDPPARDAQAAMTPELTTEQLKTLAFHCGATATRITSRIQAVIERDGPERAAVTGPGFGIGILFARDIESCLIEADSAITALTAVLAERGLLLAGIRREIEDSDHPDYCQSNRDSCAKCGEEFDGHPNEISDGWVCGEFVFRPCDCALKGIPAALPAPGPLVEAVREAVLAGVEWAREDRDALDGFAAEGRVIQALDRLAALAPASWREPK